MKKYHIFLLIFSTLSALLLLSACTAPLSSGTCGKDGANLKWKLNTEGLLTISGKGEMMSYSFEDPAPWNEYVDSVTHVTLTNGVTSIGEKAFWGCKNLSSLDIPKSLISIEDDSFSHCENLSEIYLPDGIEMLGDHVFSSCPNLKLIEVSKDNSFLYIEEGVLFSKPEQRLIWYPATSTNESYVVPNGTRTIAGSAFLDSERLVAVTFPETLTSIGDAAFCGCNGLTAISIPDSVTTIGKWAFEDCASLATVSLSAKLDSIGDYAFAYCHKLTSISIPNGVSSIGEGTFYYCTCLTDVLLPDNLQSIDDRAFHLCENLSTINLPDSLYTIGNYAFFGCGLDEIILPSDISTIGVGTFSDCDSLIIYVSKDSYAERYCQETELNYRILSAP